MTPEIGTIVAGKYRIERVLGEGGMGIVVAAYHTVLHQNVALKFLSTEALGNSEKVERFLREARASARLQSEHVARVSDVGTLESGSPFIVMEFLEGKDLAHVIESNEQGLPIEIAVDYVLQALDALAEAHAIGIVHRDIKPANLFVARRMDGQNVIKVLDFGISKVTSFGSEGVEAALTKTSSIVGTPFYMSPEQFRSAKKVDFRTDLWSVGVILYELLTGTIPFVGETVGEVYTATLETTAPSIRERRPGVPEALEQVVLRCLRKNRDERFESAADLARALAPFGSGRAAKSVERTALVHQQSKARRAAEVDATQKAPRLDLVVSSDNNELDAAAAAAVGAPLPPQVLTGRALPNSAALPQTADGWGTQARLPERPAEKRSPGTVALIAITGGVLAVLVIIAGVVAVRRSGQPREDGAVLVTPPPPPRLPPLPPLPAVSSLPPPMPPMPSSVESSETPPIPTPPPLKPPLPSKPTPPTPPSKPPAPPPSKAPNIFDRH